MTDDVVEAMARGMWEVFCASKARSDEWPSWAELLAQGHQGMHRINEFRGYARAAIRALHERGGLVVARMPADIEALTSAGHAYNMALAKVRAAAVEVEG